MKDIVNKYTVLVFIVVIFLITLLVLVNLNIIDTKVIDKKIDKVTEKYTKETTTTTAKVTVSININGIDTVINVKDYNSYLGFSLSYDYDYFDVETFSDSSVVFTDKTNKYNYLKVSKLTESVYTEEYNLNKDGLYKEDNELDTSSYEYLFYRIGDYYFKITKCIDITSNKKEELSSRYDYMVLSLKEH